MNDAIRDHLNFGEKIKRLRLSKNLRLTDLSEMTGFSVSLLSQLENNKTTPSVVTLYQLSHALDQPIGAFFEDIGTQDDFVVRRSERKKMLLDDGRIEFELLSSNLKNKKMEALIIHQQPGCISEVKTHSGEEIGLVIKGRIRVTLSGKPHDLEEGDSIYFSSMIPHRIEVLGDEEILLFWVMTPPNF